MINNAGQLVWVNVTVIVDMGTSEVLDSPFTRASLLALNWPNKSKGFYEAELTCHFPAVLLGSQTGQTFLCTFLWTAASWNCPLLYIRATPSKFLTLDSPSLFWYIFAWCSQCYTWFKKLACYLAKERLFWYCFNSLLSILLIICVNKKKILDFLPLVMVLFPNIIW